ncbi:hypothetical protein HaLaN_13309 [Haematococcus lacustris]|uniref:Uncharacterized protein n=1 Tax=Haematococcus lacustris TaxID=44745 RepID=A0A699ZM01_HAELA|nr:hypothetical protein HaLaN_13309 [Haematococcus lacustris]
MLVDVLGAMQLPGRTNLPSFLELTRTLWDCLAGMLRATDAGLKDDIELCQSLLQASQAASFKQALGLHERLALQSQGEAFQQDAQKAAEGAKAQAAMLGTWNVECKAKVCGAWCEFAFCPSVS